MLERFNYRKKFWNDLLDHSLVMAHLWNQREGIFALWNEFSFMFMLIKVEKDNNALITSPACIARVKRTPPLTLTLTMVASTHAAGRSVFGSVKD